MEKEIVLVTDGSEVGRGSLLTRRSEKNEDILY